MNFLTPLFLIGGLAIAGPILYHLIRRTTRERKIFSSLMFLLPSPPRISKRHRLQHLLLLALRCAALLLLALGFARPFFKQAPLNDPTSAQPKRSAILVDTSASMRREGAWTAARERVASVLRRAGPADHVALYTFDRQATPLLSFEEWNRAAPGDRVALAIGRLDTVTPGWGATQVGHALVTAAESLTESETKGADGRPVPTLNGPREVVLVSDLQAGSRLDTLQAYEWPKGVSLVVEPVRARHATNAGLQLVADALDTHQLTEPVVRVRVTNSGDSKREQFKVGWGRGAAGEFAAPPIDAYVPPGQSRVFSVPVPKAVGAAQQLTLTGDDDGFDNTVYVIPPVPQRAGILWLGATNADDTKEPLFFLRRAFSDTPRLTVKLTARAPDAAIGPDEWKAANLVFVNGALPAAAAAALKERVEAGAVAVFVPASADAGGTLGAVLGREPVPLAEVQPPRYAMLAEIDFRHALFAPFADPRFSDFTKIHVWKYRRLDAAAVPGARVLAKFDSGDPAVIEVALGKGRVFVLATGWQPDDSQLAVSSKFVPLMWSFLEMGGGVAPVITQYQVGDPVPLPAEPAGNVRLPDGTQASLAAEMKEFGQTRQPGIYEFTGTTPRRFAVNLDPNESRTAPLDPDELRDLGLPLAKTAVPEAVEAEKNKALLQGVEAENRQKLWRWFIVGTLAVLLIESALAGWTARRASYRTEEATT